MSAKPSDIAYLSNLLRREGCEPGSSVHSWRCEHPDRYGPCDCVEQVAQELLDALPGLGWTRA